MVSGLETGFLLDERWYRMTSGIERSKKPDLLLLARVLAEAKIAYAVIGGLALQVHQAEPRTTLDIDLAVRDREDLPRARLESAGFNETGQFTHSNNWIGPAGTPIQFTDDPALVSALERAEEIEVEGVALRILRRADLLHAKLRAAADPLRRRSKRLQDLADAQSLLEQDPALDAELGDADRALLAGPLPL
jgi:hypothetical protein